MTRSMATGLVITGLAASVYFSATASAHHAFAAEFDRESPVQLTGTVTEMRWANPHAWIYIDVEGEDGTVVNWALETRAAHNLIRLGWRPNDVPVGAVLVIEGFQARNGSPTASIATVTFEDGRRLFAGPPDGPGQQ